MRPLPWRFPSEDEQLAAEAERCRTLTPAERLAALDDLLDLERTLSRLSEVREAQERELARIERAGHDRLRAFIERRLCDPAA